MGALEERGPDPQVLEDCTRRPLSTAEEAVLTVLTDEFICASVIKVRAGLPRAERNTQVLEACMGLARRGLAEQVGTGLRSTLRWRRARGYGNTMAAQARYHCDHLHLRSRDAVAAEAFYVEMIGAREIGREGFPTVSRVIIDIGGLTLFIEQAPDSLPSSAEAPHLGIEHIGIGVPDIEATFAVLRGRNATVVSGITDVRPGLRVIFIEGPDGVRIEFLQRSDVA